MEPPPAFLLPPALLRRKDGKMRVLKTRCGGRSQDESGADQDGRAIGGDQVGHHRHQWSCRRDSSPGVEIFSEPRDRVRLKAMKAALWQRRRRDFATGGAKSQTATVGEAAIEIHLHGSRNACSARAAYG